MKTPHSENAINNNEQVKSQSQKLLFNKQNNNIKKNIRAIIIYIVAAIIFFTIKLNHFPNFSPQAQSALAVFCTCSFLWMCNILPLAIPGLLGIILLPLSGAINVTNTYKEFANSTVFFVLSAMVLASPIMRSGLSSRISVNLISKFGTSKHKILLSIFFLSSFSAFFISEHAVAAMMFPIVLEIVNSTKAKPGSRFAFACFLAMGWGAMTGGAATLLGGARAPLALGILQESTTYTISFIDWIKYTIPIIICMLIIGFVIIYLVSRKSTVSVESARAQLNIHKSSMGKLTKREVKTIIILLITIVLWIIYGTQLGLEIVGLFGVLLAFVTRTTCWSEVEEDVRWGIIIMYGSAITLSAALQSTGAAQGLVNLIINSGLDSPKFIMGLMIILAFVLTEVMSNAASVAVLMPIGIALATQYHIDPRAITIGIATAAGLTFILPMSTCAMAIMYSTEYVSPFKTIRLGIIMKMLGLCILLIIIWNYWPSIGLPVFNINK